MVAINQVLVAGVGVNGCHESLIDPAGGMQRARHRCEAVGGAGRIRDDFHPGFEAVVVDPKNDCCVGAFRRSRDEDSAGAGLDMALRIICRGENAGAFHDEVNAPVAPMTGFRIAMADIVDALAVDLYISVAMEDLPREAAMR